MERHTEKSSDIKDLLLLCSPKTLLKKRRKKRRLVKANLSYNRTCVPTKSYYTEKTNGKIIILEKYCPFINHVRVNIS